MGIFLLAGIAAAAFGAVALASAPKRSEQQKNEDKVKEALGLMVDAIESCGIQPGQQSPFLANPDGYVEDLRVAMSREGCEPYSKKIAIEMAPRAYEFQGLEIWLNDCVKKRPSIFSAAQERYMQAGRVAVEKRSLAEGVTLFRTLMRVWGECGMPPSKSTAEARTVRAIKKLASQME